LAEELQFDGLDTKGIDPIEAEGLHVFDDTQVGLPNCTGDLENLILPVCNIELSLLVPVNKVQQFGDTLEVASICEYVKVQGNKIKYEGS
jgi:hypothetical protein